MKGDNQFTHPWSNQEIEFVINNYLKLNNIEMKRSLNNRSTRAISNKLIILNLHRPSDIRSKLMSELYSNGKSPFFGRKHTIATKKILSEKKIILFKEGKIIPTWKGKKNPWTKKRNLSNNPMNNLDTREKSRNSNINRKTYENNSNRMKLDNPSRNGLTKEWKERIGIASRNKWKDPIFRLKMKNSTQLQNLIISNKKESTRIKRRESTKRMWRDENIRNKLLKGLKLNPNKVETILINLIQTNNLNFKFVGDGKVWFNGENHTFNPDFIDEDNKFIIEVFGNYWHNKDQNRIKDIERLQTYEKEGYRTLVIWEYELISKNRQPLKDYSEIMNKIYKFFSIVIIKHI